VLVPAGAGREIGWVVGVAVDSDTGTGTAVSSSGGIENVSGDSRSASRNSEK
jgi:hypothetical protein